MSRYNPFERLISENELNPYSRIFFDSLYEKIDNTFQVINGYHYGEWRTYNPPGYQLGVLDYLGFGLICTVIDCLDYLLAELMSVIEEIFCTYFHRGFMGEHYARIITRTLLLIEVLVRYCVSFILTAITLPLILPFHAITEVIRNSYENAIEHEIQIIEKEQQELQGQRVISDYLKQDKRIKDVRLHPEKPNHIQFVFEQTASYTVSKHEVRSSRFFTLIRTVNKDGIGSRIDTALYDHGFK